MRIEFKTTCWKRVTIAEHDYGLIKYLEVNPEASSTDILNWCLNQGFRVYIEECEGTERDLTPEENGGRATIEVSDPMKGDEVLFINGKP